MRSHVVEPEAEADDRSTDRSDTWNGSKLRLKKSEKVEIR
jgi:hypothetical protein